MYISYMRQRLTSLTASLSETVLKQGWNEVGVYQNLKFNHFGCTTSY